MVKEEVLLLGVKQYRFGYVTFTTHFAFHEHLNEQDSTDIQKMDIGGKPRQQQTTERPHKATTIETLTRRTAYTMKTDTLNVF